MKKNYILISLGILAGLNILAWIAVFQLNHPYLEVDFFSVGQGDAELIETPQGHQILIDGGPSSAILEKLGKEMPFWDRTIDLVILTHPEKDHITGLLEVLKRYKVENILWTGVVRDTPEYKEWVKLLEKEGANVFLAKAGQKIAAGLAKLEVLFPAEDISGEILKDSNDSSIVIKLVYGSNSFLFTGDLTKAGESAILSEKADVDSDVLKVGHHGSKTSSSDPFLSVVSPIYAVIEVGKNNRYGHPAQEVLDRLKNYGIHILRTDINGDIKFFSNGENLAIK